MALAPTKSPIFGIQWAVGWAVGWESPQASPRHKQVGWAIRRETQSYRALPTQPGTQLDLDQDH